MNKENWYPECEKCKCGNLDKVYCKKCFDDEKERIMMNLDYVLVYGLKQDLSEKEIKNFKKMFKAIIWRENEKRTIKGAKK